MNDNEKMEFYIAMCECCLLAQAMKNCSLCRFNIGLAEQVRPLDPIPLPNHSQFTVFAMAE